MKIYLDTLRRVREHEDNRLFGIRMDIDISNNYYNNNAIGSLSELNELNINIIVLNDILACIVVYCKLQVLDC